MSQAPSVGYQGKFAVDTTGVTSISDFDASSIQLEIISEAIKKMQSHADSQGIRGTRSQSKERVRIAREAVGGSFTLYPTPIELDTLFPLILGGVKSSTSFPVAETLPVFGVLVDRKTKCFTYPTNYVNRAVFSGTSGQLIKLMLDIAGKTEIVSAAGGFPGTVPAIDSGQPYVFSDTTFSLSIGGTASEIASFELTIDNVLDLDHYYNSVTRTQIVPLNRVVTLKLVPCYDSDSVALYDQAVAGAGGSLTLTNGGCSTVFTFGNLKVPAESPVITGKNDPILLPLTLRAYSSGTAGATKEIAVTHDSTP